MADCVAPAKTGTIARTPRKKPRPENGEYAPSFVEPRHPIHLVGSQDVSPQAESEERRPVQVAEAVHHECSSHIADPGAQHDPACLQVTGACEEATECDERVGRHGGDDVLDSRAAGQRQVDHHVGKPIHPLDEGSHA